MWQSHGMHLKIERLFRDTIGSVTATSPKPAPSAPDPVVDNISTSSITRIDARTAGAPALLVGVCPIMGATTTLDIFCAIAVPTLGCRAGFNGFAATAPSPPAEPACGNAAGWFFLSSQSGVGSLDIGGGITPASWLSPLSMPSNRSA